MCALRRCGGRSAAWLRLGWRRWRGNVDWDTVRCKSGKDEGCSSLFMPAHVPVKVAHNPDDINIGEELTNKLKKEDLLKMLNQFNKRPPIMKLGEENGLDARLFHQAFIGFRKFCMESDTLPVELHIVLSDILQGAGHVDDIFPYFLKHARQMYPHLEYMDELKKISDLRLPANWYPQARAITRKIIFHAGPTNSGKTHHALKRFIGAKSGVYCGPLKLLAAEVHSKTNEAGTPCDLVTGEERRTALPDGMPSPHVACTVEMTSVTTAYEVAIIDEIQMMRDIARGWAWTRSLLGVAADEVHLCGEEAALDLVRELVSSLGEELEVRRYKRLTKLTVEDQALERLENVQPGDCIVCFGKSDIYHVSLQMERQKKECAVIYGGLPPGTKLAQAGMFNDPNHPCKILVATDAIGMGLNLSIRRIIFYSLLKPTLNEKGEKEMDTISTSQALQIAGRAGRFGTQFLHGFVTTFRKEDLPILKDLLVQPVDPIEAAGLHPTADQIELFAYYLPHATLSNLIDIFVSLSQVNRDCYFMCNIDDFKFLADMIQHVPLPLRARYVFCCAPMNRTMPFVCAMFLKFARQYSQNQVLTFDWLCRNIGWPFTTPKTIMELVHLEGAFDVLDMYLWLSYRFQDLFPDVAPVRHMQQELDCIIQQGVINITHLLHARAASLASGHSWEAEDEFAVPSGKSGYARGHLSDLAARDHDRKLQITKNSQVSIGRGRLTNRLLEQGLITPEMVEELKRELLEHETNLARVENGSPNATPKGGKKKPGRPRKKK